MKILMTTDTVGGTWAYTMELARALQPFDVEVILAAMGPALSDEQREEVNGRSNIELHEGPFQPEWMDDSWADVGEAGAWLLRIEDRLRPDVVHLNGYVHAALPWHAPRVVVGHGSVVGWWQAVRGEPAPQRWDRYRDEVRRGLQAADLVIASTRAMLRELDRYYGPLPASQVIPHGRSPSVFCGGIKEPFVFAAGRLWDEARNTAALAEVARRVSWPIYIAGEDKQPESGLPEHQRVRLLGPLAADAVPSWLARAAVYALPARYEPFGLAALEAALSRCALVLGDIPSLREVWRDVALFVPPGDHDALQAALTSLITDGNLRNDLAIRAYNRALKFTSETAAASYHHAYHSLVAALQQR